jgi:hypothetical protein
MFLASRSADVLRHLNRCLPVICALSKYDDRVRKVVCVLLPRAALPIWVKTEAAYRTLPLAVLNISDPQIFHLARTQLPLASRLSIAFDRTLGQAGLGSCRAASRISMVFETPLSFNSRAFRFSRLTDLPCPKVRASETQCFALPCQATGERQG